MSPIFPLEQREKIQESLLEAGVCLIKQKGIKGMTIDDVTTYVGIGKGTFYHFFSSKEQYVEAVIHFSKENMLKAINKIIDEKGGIDREAMMSLFQTFSFTSKNNIISFMTQEDEDWLMQKLPDFGTADHDREEAMASMLLKHIRGVRKDINLLVVANMIKIMALAAENRRVLHQDALEETLFLMQQELCNYIFKD